MKQKSKKSLLARFLVWRIKHIPNERFIHILSVVVGILSGLLAVLLKNITSFFHSLTEYPFFKDNHFLYLIAPIVGIILTYLIIRYVLKKDVGHAIPETLYSISKKKGIIPFHKIFSPFLTAPFTVGFGGSVGLEGPAVSATSAMASNVSRVLRLNQANRTLLLGCAAAAAMSAMFKAPIAAIVFAIEVFSLDLTLVSLLPLLFASVSAILISYLFMGSEILFHFTLEKSFELKTIVFYIPFAVLCGFTSLYFSKTYLFFEKIFGNIKSKFKKLLFGGIALGILIYLFPAFYGEGFKVINYLLEENYQKITEKMLFLKDHTSSFQIISLLILMVFFKIVATSITFGSGGKGGVFAPSLFTGSVLGQFFAKVVNQFNFVKLDPSHFTLVGMAGVIAGVLHAPLTAIFLIAELTGGYGLFLPLMITVGISFAINKSFMPYTLYTYKLKQRDQLITHDKDMTVLTLMEIKTLVENNFVPLKPDMLLGQMLKKGVAKSTRNLFPVINENKELVGIILLDDIREFMFDVSQYDTLKVVSFMRNPPTTINFEKDNMRQIMQKFEQSRAWNLPVIKNGKYFGFISKSKLLTEYRKQLIDFTDAIK